MKKILIAVFVLFTSFYLHAQTAGSFKDSLPVKGFYLTYEEYLNNSPSYRPDFKTILYKTKNDTLIIAADYVLPENVADSVDCWAFSDGKSVFVKNSTLFENYYWKVQCPGPNPFYYIYSKSIIIPLSINSIAAGIISVAAKPVYDLWFIDKEGRSHKGSRMYLNNLFKDEPELRKKLRYEDSVDDDIAEKYLLKYNAAKMKN